VPAALLLDVARAAFTAGLNVVAAIGAIIFIALAILIATALRRLHLGGEAADRGESVADGVQAR
jgi:DHA2 family multidrug resistance protein-like MFS transporter